LTQKQYALDFFESYKARNFTLLVYAFATVLTRCWIILETDKVSMLHHGKWNMRSWAQKDRLIWFGASCGLALLIDILHFVYMTYETDFCYLQPDKNLQPYGYNTTDVIAKAATIQRVCSHTVDVYPVRLGMAVVNVACCLLTCVFVFLYIRYISNKYKTT
jgi:hypothetical protein